MGEVEKKEESSTLTPIQKVRQRLGDGVPIEKLLRYMHAQSSVPRTIRDLVDLVVRLKEGIGVLTPLTDDIGGLLRTFPGSKVEHASDLVVAVRSLNVAVTKFLPEVRNKLEELIEEVGSGQEPKGTP